MGIKKRSTLKAAFWKFLILLLGGLFGAVMIPYMILAICVTLGIVTYANYSEMGAKEIAPIIAAAPELAEIRLPAGVQYALLDKNFELLGTNMNEKDMKRALAYANTGINEKNPDKQFLLITRDAEYVVLQYYIGSQFTNDWIKEHFPPPEILLTVLVMINGIIVCAFLTASFSKKLRLQLEPLFDATSEVAKQNLDFEVGHSEIKEFEEVLSSFNDMKENLKSSLEQQWRAEQVQREQIAALAHDLKTPLTVIRGNADLITETKLNEEQRLYAEFITDSSRQMELYVKTLIDVSRTTAGYQLHLEEVDAAYFMNKIEELADALSRAKGVVLCMRTEKLPVTITVDKLLMERAIINVVTNAMEYSPKGGIIQICVTSDNDCFIITVLDEGRGFSQEELLHAQEQFYMGDNSRSSKLHFGMGLYITESIVKQHKGELVLENSEETGGARVTIRLNNLC